ncbi:EAL domain, c-di-GMP-specific phosphodiesterase class I (or its enzymatically inactive variant) [Butyrivibrio fibrisolvens DSM 3071]|uniref:EAL domain, c-di-GMP-specific phosphodiesterase class I (Or its enzymatically inactive variant) n=1 Tax=Butyrivibrio fibrisolvens DSM 3071 TaxID=1121131 RepID=A0A1M6E5J0_BUTFI|nr:EAL domain-containing protein [Butyrivibrio fibrisolvens]SHI80538.1 EAL domain, c-di-GMP-specific phosphodiesterase class I (or its enzymatically inactive variant) [Butyrivibrio fibrisolvens DSM 3071]
MIWNVYFEIAALLISVVLMLSDLWKKHLPFRSWNYFSWLISLQIVSCFMNIVACGMAKNPSSYSITAHYIVNIAYYVSYIMQIWSFAIFTIAMTGKSKSIKRSTWFIFAFPYLLSFLSVVLTPYTHMFFYIDETGLYHRGWGYYNTWLVFLAFYILLPLSYAWYYKVHMAPNRMVYTIGFWSLSLTGMILQGFVFTDVLLEGIFNAAAIIIIYLDIQNPSQFTDADIGIYNQWALGEVIDEKLEYGDPIDISVIGIENFPVLESIYGRRKLMRVLHDIGDEITEQVKGVNLFYMHRGRFALLFNKNINHKEIEQAIRRRFEMPWGEEDGKVTFKIHITHLGEDVPKMSIREIFDSLEEGLRIAEMKDNEVTENISAARIEEIRAGIKVERAVSKAIRERRIKVAFQPIYSTKKERIISIEALARLEDEELGIIEPDQFIPIAEKNGTIGFIGSQVFEQVCSFIRERDMEDLGVRFIEINLSPIQCKSGELVSDLFNLMDRYEIDPKQINFEITESAMTDGKILKEMMNKIIERGSTFSLDDYGTGYSNLVELLELPFRIVKIDKSLVWSYFNGTSDVLPDIVKTFSSRGYEIVAEGVETHNMAEKLRDMGCDYLQGFYFSKALPADQLVSYVYNNRRLRIMEEMRL